MMHVICQLQVSVHLQSSLIFRSYILLSENSLISSLWLIKFLSRLSQPVPPLLEIVGRKCVEVRVCFSIDLVYCIRAVMT